jgi:hypothetical protein
MKRLWFLVMVGMWGAFIALAAVSPETLAEIWTWVRDRSWPIEVLLWIVFLPWMIGLAIWQSGWADGLRWLLIAVLAFGWSVASWPRKR